MKTTYNVTYMTAEGLFIKDFEIEDLSNTVMLQTAAIMEIGSFRKLLPLHDKVYAEIRTKDTGDLWCYLTVVSSEEFENEHHGRKGYVGRFAWHNADE